MATKTYTVVIEEAKLFDVPDDKITQLENTFKNIVEEINLTNGSAQLKVVSIQEQT
jgi:hypothetical protein